MKGILHDKMNVPLGSAKYSVFSHAGGTISFDICSDGPSYIRTGVSLTPNQARDLAADLMRAASVFEAVAAEVAA